MLWLEKFDVDDGRLCPVVIDTHGQRTSSHLSKLHQTLVQLKYREPIEVVGLDLQSLSRSDSLDYTRSLGVEDATADGHEVFCFTSEGRQVLVPAAVILYAFIPRMHAFGDRLLTPGSLDMSITPVVSGRGIEVGLPRGSKLSATFLTPGLKNKLLWLSCFRSGRKFWGSVYEKARHGVVGLELPAVRVDGKLYGIKRNGKFFATRLALRSMTPMEEPLGFAAPFLPARLDVNERFLAAAANIRAVNAKAEQKPRLAVPLGPNGWHLTDAEWELALSRCHENGHPLHRSSRSLVDQALVKLASGQPWRACGEQKGGSARLRFSRWKSTGAWDILLSVVRERVPLQEHSTKP